MSTKNVTIRMDEELKEASEKLFEALGFNMTTAITAFVKQAVREQRIPFEISLNTPNMQTVQAILESERLLKDSAAKRFSSMEDLIKDLEDDEI
ncbi:DNA-damage-inducible protein J [Dethiosulfatibacter aminovorans DSM 17477]|uniref:DNA-damage-inducible protein J n=1 Tax=Dethiosulfatibacter aminovorans DSM 17477 TaxID=1121476 RepID=A0A1M6GA16_9FIRM|nr:type II toxin-antitoxin system RelB/DinJ family antitoxin [Dethiosulfatibacter aminovorans]SHJ06782.1 DNA-damage-inducible protein J [Dethiosulfatibacter aminovorans DSM 17477]